VDLQELFVGLVNPPNVLMSSMPNAEPDAGARCSSDELPV
jgi:hypothetical protein